MATIITSCTTIHIARRIVKNTMPLAGLRSKRTIWFFAGIRKERSKRTGFGKKKQRANRTKARSSLNGKLPTLKRLCKPRFAAFGPAASRHRPRPTRSASPHTRLHASQAASPHFDSGCSFPPLPKSPPHRLQPSSDLPGISASTAKIASKTHLRGTPPIKRPNTRGGTSRELIINSLLNSTRPRRAQQQISQDCTTKYTYVLQSSMKTMLSL